jgi:hypothetical protein
MSEPQKKLRPGFDRDLTRDEMLQLMMFVQAQKDPPKPVQVRGEREKGPEKRYSVGAAILNYPDRVMFPDPAKVRKIKEMKK